MEILSTIFEPSLKITFSTIITVFPFFFFLYISYRVVRGKKNLELVRAELSITNPKLYYELNQDKEKEELILENGTLKEELNALKKENSKLSIMAFIMLLISIIYIAFKGRKSSNDL